MSFRFTIPKLHEHATAIGYVCIHWSDLETHINLILSQVTPLPGDGAARCITNNADVRDKIQMLKAVGFLHKPSDEWFEALSDVLDRIDNEIRPQRNRFIHDEWVDTGGPEPIRRTHKTALSKPQAYVRNISHYSDTPVGLDDVWDVVRQIMVARMDLDRLLLEFEVFAGRLPPEMLPPRRARQSPHP
jgi:hypothetical protein